MFGAPNGLWMGSQEWFVCPMSSAMASGGQSEIPEGVEMMWEAELGVPRP